MYLKSQIGLNFGSDNMSIYVDKEFTQKKKKFNRLLSQLGDIVGGSESSIEQD